MMKKTCQGSHIRTLASYLKTGMIGGRRIIARPTQNTPHPSKPRVVRVLYLTVQVVLQSGGYPTMAEETFPDFRLPHRLHTRPLDLMSLGNAKMEMVVKVPHWPGDGGQHEVSMSLPVYSAGGCAMNVACFAGRLGGQVALLARVGDGRYSKEILAEIERSRVSLAHARRFPGHEGSLLLIITNPQGDWTVLEYMDPELEVRPEDMPEDEFFKRTRILHIEGFTLAKPHQRRAVELAIERARTHDCLVSADAAVPVAVAQPTYLARLFAECDIVFANRTEALAITGAASIEEAVPIFQSMGPEVTFLKLGSEGSLAITRDSVGRVPAFEVPISDTIAAGDAYVAAVLMALCRGRTLLEAAREGSSAGALSCQGAGSLSSWFTHEDVAALVASVYPVTAGSQRHD
jgi:ribokinase